MTATPPTAPPTMAPIGAEEFAGSGAGGVVGLLVVVAEPAVDDLEVLVLGALVLLLSEVDDVDDGPFMDKVGL